MTRRIAIVFFAIVTGMLSTKHARADDPLRQDAVKRFGVLEAVPAEKVSAPDVRLGQSLFWDQRLSGNGKTACASCHLTQDWGADHRRFSLDSRWKNTSRNSQTIFNAVLQPSLRWTGDRKSGAHQADFQLPTSWASVNPRWMSVSLVMPRHKTMLPGGASRVRFR